MRTWLTLSLLSTSLAAQSVVSVDLTAAPGVVDLG
ncbi:MAG: hypothetical protein ACI9S9_002855, partial [Planctomycetota bacterium]